MLRKYTFLSLLHQFVMFWLRTPHQKRGFFRIIYCNQKLLYMDNEQIKALQDKAWEVIANVQHAVRTLTAENPLILFDKDTIESDDDTLYDLPFGYYVGKYEYYNEGTIWKVHGNDVTIMLRGEEFGDTWELTVDQLPFESVVQLLEFLIKKS